MSNAPTSTPDRDAAGMTIEDRARLRERTEAQITAAAMADPDAQPIPPERLARMRRPLAKAVRQKLKMTRDEFASAYGIPLPTLTAWERQDAVPSETELVYLQLIERNPEAARHLTA